MESDDLSRNQSRAKKASIRNYNIISVVFGLFFLFYFLSKENFFSEITFSAIGLVLFFVFVFYLIKNPDALTKLAVKRKELHLENVLFEYSYPSKKVLGGYGGNFFKKFSPNFTLKLTFTEDGFVIDSHPQNSTVFYYNWNYFKYFLDHVPAILNNRYNQNENLLVLFLKNEYIVETKNRSGIGEVVIYLDPNFRERVLDLISKHVPKRSSYVR